MPDAIILQVINEQLETDQQLRNLVAAMKHAYEFVRKAAPLEKITEHVEFFEKLASATLECAHLIQEYVRAGNFGELALDSLPRGCKLSLY